MFGYMFGGFIAGIIVTSGVAVYLWYLLNRKYKAKYDQFKLKLELKKIDKRNK